MFRSLETKKEYLSLLGELSNRIIDAATIFLYILGDFQNYEQMYPNLIKIEQDAHKITHKINEKLCKSYMSPFEPADIHDLARKMDSILNIIASSTRKLEIYKLKQPLEDVLQLALFLNEAASKIQIMMKSLGDPKNFESILSMCNDVRGLEGKAVEKYYQLLKKLFATQEDAIELFNRKQILEHIEEATNTCEHISDIIEGIILKNG